MFRPYFILSKKVGTLPKKVANQSSFFTYKSEYKPLEASNSAFADLPEPVIQTKRPPYNRSKAHHMLYGYKKVPLNVFFIYQHSALSQSITVTELLLIPVVVNFLNIIVLIKKIKNLVHALDILLIGQSSPGLRNHCYFCGYSGNLCCL